MCDPEEEGCLNVHVDVTADGQEPMGLHVSGIFTCCKMVWRLAYMNSASVFLVGRLFVAECLP